MMTNTANLLVYVLSIWVSLIVFSCGGSNSSDTEFLIDAGGDAGKKTVHDAGKDSEALPEQPTEEDAGRDTDPPEPVSAGQDCWNKDVFPDYDWHPNAKLPNCIEGLRCIGTPDDARCTTTCAITGAFNDQDPGLAGWCCGELTDPCAPKRYWLPPSMSFHCIPRTAILTETCERNAEWEGGETRRCTPMCDGEKESTRTLCGAYSDGSFCTFECDPANGNVDCLLEPAFEGGCCGEIAEGNWCLIPSLCTSS